ncbi:hypothetical protein EVA_06990 [gut metagenome]|uniref:Uncharacterized protein n=1 Tax=gut metagenome TaxID=749906 RepID=J9CXB3_9ZZZZ
MHISTSRHSPQYSPSPSNKILSVSLSYKSCATILSRIKTTHFIFFNFITSLFPILPTPPKNILHQLRGCSDCWVCLGGGVGSGSAGSAAALPPSMSCGDI